MESRNLFQDDLTEERMPTPAQREEAAHSTRLDPDVLNEDDTDDDDDDEEDDEEEPD